MVRIASYDQSSDKRVLGAGEQGGLLFLETPIYNYKLNDFESILTIILKLLEEIKIPEKRNSTLSNSQIVREILSNLLLVTDTKSLIEVPAESKTPLPLQQYQYCTIDSKWAYLRDALSEKAFFNIAYLVNKSIHAAIGINNDSNETFSELSQVSIYHAGCISPFNQLAEI